MLHPLAPSAMTIAVTRSRRRWLRLRRRRAGRGGGGLTASHTRTRNDRGIPARIIAARRFPGGNLIVHAARFGYALSRKTRLNAGGQVASGIPFAAFCGYAFCGPLLLTGQTPPVRPITAGVYS